MIIYPSTMSRRDYKKLTKREKEIYKQYGNMNYTIVFVGGYFLVPIVTMIFVYFFWLILAIINNYFLSFDNLVMYLKYYAMQELWENCIVLGFKIAFQQPVFWFFWYAVLVVIVSIVWHGCIKGFKRQVELQNKKAKNEMISLDDYFIKYPHQYPIAQYGTKEEIELNKEKANFYHELHCKSQWYNSALYNTHEFYKLPFVQGGSEYLKWNFENKSAGNKYQK